MTRAPGGNMRNTCMACTARTATTECVPRLVDRLVSDAKERQAVDPVPRKMAADAPEQIEKTLTFALTSGQPPFRQIWQVSKPDAEITAVILAMRLPVPPILAGRQGDPGLILPDSAVTPLAPGA